MQTIVQVFHLCISRMHKRALFPIFYVFFCIFDPLLWIALSWRICILVFMSQNMPWNLQNIGTCYGSLSKTLCNGTRWKYLFILRWRSALSFTVGLIKVCSPPFSAGAGGWTSYQIFKKEGLTGPVLEGGSWERGGWSFTQGLQFYIKKKLRSEIFNDKKSL